MDCDSPVLRVVTVIAVGLSWIALVQDPVHRATIVQRVVSVVGNFPVRMLAYSVLLKAGCPIL
jgi:hypothetical protein